MNLVIANMSNVDDWRRGVVNRNYFVVRELIRSGQFEQVLLVDFLAVNPLTKLFGVRRTVKYFGHVWRSVGTRLGWRHVLWADETWGCQKPVHVLSGIGLSHTLQADINHVNQAMEMLHFPPSETVLWSYNAFLPELLDIPAAMHIFDAVDNWSLHASYKQEAALLQKNYAKIGQKAEMIFTVSEGLQSLFPAKKTHWIPNGVDLDSFQKNSPTPEDITAVKKPVIGYIGTVQERLDFALLEQVCQQHHDKSFVFIGPVWAGVQSEVNQLTKQCANVHFMGRRSYEHIAAYLAAMDVTIIPHRLDAFISSTNPMKMYDYLAAGKPVVTTPGAGTEEFATHMFVVEGAAAFSAAIEQALQAGGEPYASQRRAAVAAHTWASRVQAMQTEIGRRTPQKS